MKTPVTPTSTQEPAFWDIFVLKEDGQWLGIRAPWLAFRRVTTLLTLLFAVSGLAVTGWLLSRWQSARLERSLVLERLKSISLESQVNELRLSSAPGASSVKSIEAVTSSFSLIPSLGDDGATAGSVAVEDPQVGFDPVSHDLRVNFEIVRQGPRDIPTRYYWVVLLHGPQGVLSLPPAFASRAGESIQFHRGQAVDDVKIRRSVSSHFKIKEFFDAAGTEPVYATLLMYDAKGSLVVRKRQEIAFSRAAQVEKEER